MEIDALQHYIFTVCSIWQKWCNCIECSGVDSDWDFISVSHQLAVA